jgi:hypothetical protein
MGFVAGIDRAHIEAEIKDIETALVNTERTLKLGLIALAKGTGSIVGVGTLQRQQRDLQADLNRRRAELRMIDGSGEVIDPDSVTREMVAAVESGDWPLPLVEVLYLACRRVLHIEEHLPEAPVTQWH